MSDAIRRFIFQKHYGATALELRVDRGVAQMELVAQWSRDDVDKAKAAIEKPDPGVLDVVAELVLEAQDYTDQLNAPVLFAVRMVKSDGVCGSRPYRVKPSAAAVAATNPSAVPFEVFDAVLQAVLKSNIHIRESSAENTKFMSAIAASVGSVLDIVAKQKVEAAEPASVAAVPLSDEEREEVLARAAVMKGAASKVPELIDLVVAGVSKWAKIGEEDEGMLRAAGEVAKRTAALTNGAAPTEATTQ